MSGFAGEDTAAEAAGAAPRARGEDVEMAADDDSFIRPEDIAEEYDLGPGSADEGGEMSDDEGAGEAELDGADDATKGLPDVEDTALATFGGHFDSVYCVAVNPTRPAQFLTGGGDDRGFLWVVDAPASSGGGGASSGIVADVRELSGHADSVCAVGFSPDGALAATGAFDGRVLLWDATTGALKATLEGPDDVEWLCWHTRGNIVLAGSGDATVWMWMATGGACMQVFAGHEAKVTCGMFTSNGKAVVTGSDDCSVRVWAPKTGECRHAFAGHGCHEGPVTCLAAHPDPDQPHLVLSGSEDGTAKLLHLQSRRVLATLQHSGFDGSGGSDGSGFDLGGGGGAASGAAGAAMGAAAAGGGVGADAVGGVTSVEAVGFAASHPWAATGGVGGTAKVWDVATARERHAFRHPAGVTKLRWHPTTPLLFTSCADGIVRLWDARTGSIAREYTGHRDMVLDFELCGAAGTSGAAAGAAPRWLVSVSDDHTAKVFDIGDI
ncbi:unnamed protein product [Phaeothamnion confervicola]